MPCLDRIDAAVRKQFAELIRNKKEMEAIRFLRTSTKFELAEAKAVMQHITRHKGQCHWCKGELHGEASVCPKCRSINLDW